MSGGNLWNTPPQPGLLARMGVKPGRRRSRPRRLTKADEAQLKPFRTKIRPETWNKVLP